MQDVGFTGELTQKILNGYKTSTIRLFSEGRFEEGEIVAMFNSDTQTCFGHAVLMEVYDKQLGALTEGDLEGNEPFASQETMIATFQGFYPHKKVDHHSPATVVRFIFTPLTSQDNG